MTTRLSVPFLSLVAVPLLLIVSSGVIAAAARPSEQEVACGGGVLDNRVVAQFRLAAASQFWDRFPEALDLPELRRNDPAYVLVFANPYTFFMDGLQYRDVVCVVVGDTPYVYYDVAMENARLTDQ